MAILEKNIGKVVNSKFLANGLELCLSAQHQSPIIRYPEHRNFIEGIPPSFEVAFAKIY